MVRPRSTLQSSGDCQDDADPFHSQSRNRLEKVRNRHQNKVHVMWGRGPDWVEIPEGWSATDQTILIDVWMKWDYVNEEESGFILGNPEGSRLLMVIPVDLFFDWLADQRRFRIN